MHSRNAAERRQKEEQAATAQKQLKLKEEAERRKGTEEEAERQRQLKVQTQKQADDGARQLREAQSKCAEHAAIESNWEAITLLKQQEWDKEKQALQKRLARAEEISSGQVDTIRQCRVDKAQWDAERVQDQSKWQQQVSAAQGECIVLEQQAVEQTAKIEAHRAELVLLEEKHELRVEELKV